MLERDFELPLEEIALKPFDFRKIFPGKEKIEFEIGFCSGLFLREYANLKQDTGFFGIEISRKFIERGKKNLEKRLSGDNVKVIRFDAAAVLKELVPFNSLDAIHVYFPDPWPKSKHHKFRILQFKNFIIFANRLKKGGKLYIATDHPEYGEFIRKEIKYTTTFLKQLPYGEADREIMTKWEKKQIADGWPINYFLLEKA